MRRFNILREDNLLDNANDKKMNFNINVSIDNPEENELGKKFIKELTNALEKFNQDEKVNTENIKLTEDEEWEFYKGKRDFLHSFFQKELSNPEKGEIFIVTDKYENDVEYHRYKVTQYKNNAEYKYVTFEKDLPENVAIGDVVRKIDGKYIYDYEATKYVNDTIQKIKREIIEKR